MSSYTNERGERVVDTHEIVDVYEIGDIEVSVQGFNWNVEQEAWENYDLFYDGQCLNLGDAFGAEKPTKDQVREYLRQCEPSLLTTGYWADQLRETNLDPAAIDDLEDKGVTPHTMRLIYLAVGGSE